MAMANDRMKIKTIVEQRVYRNEALASWIEENIPCEHWESAWDMAFHLAQMFPEIKDRIRGELIDESFEEETKWA